MLLFLLGCCLRVGPRDRQDRPLHAHREVEEQWEAARATGTPAKGMIRKWMQKEWTYCTVRCNLSIQWNRKKKTSQCYSVTVPVCTWLVSKGPSLFCTVSNIFYTFEFVALVSHMCQLLAILEGNKQSCSVEMAPFQHSCMHVGSRVDIQIHSLFAFGLSANPTPKVLNLHYIMSTLCYVKPMTWRVQKYVMCLTQWGIRKKNLLRQVVCILWPVGNYGQHPSFSFATKEGKFVSNFHSAWTTQWASIFYTLRDNVLAAKLCSQPSLFFCLSHLERWRKTFYLSLFNIPALIIKHSIWRRNVRKWSNVKTVWIREDCCWSCMYRVSKLPLFHYRRLWQPGQGCQVHGQGFGFHVCKLLLMNISSRSENCT